MIAAADELPQLIAYRAYTPDDADFFYRSWLDSFGLDSPTTLHVPKSVYYPAQRRLIERLAARPGARIVVACLADEPSVLIGFLLAEFPGGRHLHKPIIHYIYTKRSFRRHGFAGGMCAALGLQIDNCTFSHYSYACAWVHQRWPGAIYNPYLVSETNG